MGTFRYCLYLVLEVQIASTAFIQEILDIIYSDTVIIKIDVEGHECKVTIFQTMYNFLLKSAKEFFTYFKILTILHFKRNKTTN